MEEEEEINENLDDNNHEKLYKDMFKEYKNYVIVDRKRFKILSSSNSKYYLKKSFCYPLSKKEIDSLKTVVNIKTNQNNNSVGTIKVFLEEEEIGKLNIYKKDKKKKRFSFLNS